MFTFGCLRSQLGGDDLAVFPREQGEVPALVFGAEFLGHGLGGGLAALDGGYRLRCGLGFARFGFHQRCSN